MCLWKRSQYLQRDIYMPHFILENKNLILFLNLKFNFMKQRGLIFNSRPDKTIALVLGLMLGLCPVSKAWADTNMNDSQIVAQTQKRVKGQVVDATGEPLIGVNISVIGGTEGTITDIDGNYSINVPAKAKLKFSYIGYKEQIVEVTTQTVINMKLQEDSEVLDVTIVQLLKQLMNPFDPDMASMIHNEMRKHGIKLVLGYTVEGFKEKDNGVEVLLKDNPSLQADMVVLAIGVTPDTVLAKEAGLELGIKESIVVNDRMETSVPDIYAAGDAVQVKHYVTGNDALISLAGPANKQGRIIADNICGGDSRYLGSQGSSVIKVFDMTAATTGINETNAQKSGLEVDTVILSPMSHAGYYPGGKVMTMKVIFEKESYRLLGAQIIGYEGVDKRIDVLATAIHAGLNATQLKDLDLAYAPPYSSAKDPVNMAGFMIDNIAKGTLKQWHLEDMDKISKDKDVVLLDVRTVGEFSRGHIDGFKNIPVDELRERISEIEKGKPVYLICQSGLRSYIASRILEGNGYETYNFSGGFRFYDAVVNDRALIERAYACGMDY